MQFFALLDFSGASGVSGAGKVERSFLENLRLFSFAGVLKSYLLHAVVYYNQSKGRNKETSESF